MKSENSVGHQFIVCGRNTLEVFVTGRLCWGFRNSLQHLQNFSVNLKTCQNKRLICRGVGWGLPRGAGVWVWLWLWLGLWGG